MDIARNIVELESELIELRRDLHRHPELGLQEHRTGKKVAEYLNKLGLAVTRMNQTGVVGLLQGESPGPTLLLRADMDALPIQEETGLDYQSSVDGVMHACGHDAHTAMMMIAAKILTSVKERLAGDIKFVFQPNEENVGALAMIEEGLMENPKVDACFGVHVWAPLKTGQLGISAGPVMAGMEHFDLLIKGRGAHRDPTKRRGPHPCGRGHNQRRAGHPDPGNRHSQGTHHHHVRENRRRQCIQRHPR